MIEEDCSPLQLGPFQVEHLGRRGGLPTLQVRIGGQTVRILADRGTSSARVSAEIDGKKLTRRRKPRPWRRWSDDPTVKKWVVAAAAEVDDGVPRWTCKEIARNLKRTRRGEMTGEAVRRLIWRLAPELARRRADYWRLKRRKKGTTTKKRKKTAASAAEREAVVEELKRAGLL